MRRRASMTASPIVEPLAEPPVERGEELSRAVGRNSVRGLDDAQSAFIDRPLREIVITADDGAAEGVRVLRRGPTAVRDRQELHVSFDQQLHKLLRVGQPQAVFSARLGEQQVSSLCRQPVFRCGV